MLRNPGAHGRQKARETRDARTAEVRAKRDMLRLLQPDAGAVTYDEPTSSSHPLRKGAPHGASFCCGRSHQSRNPAQWPTVSGSVQRSRAGDERRIVSQRGHAKYKCVELSIRLSTIEFAILQVTAGLRGPVIKNVEVTRDRLKKPGDVAVRGRGANAGLRRRCGTLSGPRKTRRRHIALRSCGNTPKRHSIRLV